MKNRRAGNQPVFGKQVEQYVTSGVSRTQVAESVTMAWAAVLARKGKLKQAEAMLLPLASQSLASTGVLDLLAKVYAQQLKIEDARSLWLRAVQLEPDNTHFWSAGLRCANILKKK